MARALPIITTDKCVSGLELIENGKAGYSFRTMQDCGLFIIMVVYI